MGILRKAFVCGALLLAIPTPPDATSTGGAVPPSASTMAYVSAASDTFADVRGFCGRNPQVCATAGIVASRMEAKAKFGARVIYEWANDASGTPPQSASLPKDEAAADPIAAYVNDRLRTSPHEVTVMIPVIRARHWYERFLVNQGLRRLRRLLANRRHVAVVEQAWDPGRVAH